MRRPSPGRDRARRRSPPACSSSSRAPSPSAHRSGAAVLSAGVRPRCSIASARAKATASPAVNLRPISSSSACDRRPAAAAASFDTRMVVSGPTFGWHLGHFVRPRRGRPDFFGHRLTHWLPHPTQRSSSPVEVARTNSTSLRFVRRRRQSASQRCHKCENSSCFAIVTYYSILKCVRQPCNLVLGASSSGRAEFGV